MFSCLLKLTNIDFFQILCVLRLCFIKNSDNQVPKTYFRQNQTMSYESLRNSIDTEKLTPEQKTFLDGMKANDVLAMNGWYTMKPNADGSMVLCVSYEVMYPTDTRIMSIASYVKEVSADRMLIFSGDTSDDGKPMFDEVLSVEKSSVKPGTLYDQRLIMALPKKDGN